MLMARAADGSENGPDILKLKHVLMVLSLHTNKLTTMSKTKNTAVQTSEEYAFDTACLEACLAAERQAAAEKNVRKESWEPDEEKLQMRCSKDGTGAIWGRFFFTYSEKITRAQAFEVQTELTEYHPNGYGLWGFKQTKDGTSTWECSQNCD